MTYIWTCPVTGDSITGTVPPEEGVPFAEAAGEISPNTHFYDAGTGAAALIPPCLDDSEPHEFRPQLGRWVPLLTSDAARAAHAAERLAAQRWEVTRERDRRLAAGTVIEGIPVQGRTEDMGNLRSLFDVTQAGLMTTVRFRDRENQIHVLGAQEIQALYVGAVAWVERVYAVSWDMKDNGIPEDLTEDRHWP
jgi:hypothetical protein